MLTRREVLSGMVASTATALLPTSAQADSRDQVMLFGLPERLHNIASVIFRNQFHYDHTERHEEMPPFKNISIDLIRRVLLSPLFQLVECEPLNLTASPFPKPYGEHRLRTSFSYWLWADKAARQTVIDNTAQSISDELAIYAVHAIQRHASHQTCADTVEELPKWLEALEKNTGKKAEWIVAAEDVVLRLTGGPVANPEVIAPLGEYEGRRAGRDHHRPQRQ